MDTSKRDAKNMRGDARKKRLGKSRAIDENQQKINRCSYVSMLHPIFFVFSNVR